MIEDSTLEDGARVARGLLRLAQQHGQKGAEGICLQLALSQGELETTWAVVAAQCQPATRPAEGSQRDKIDGTQIVITDEEGLTDIADAASPKD